MRVLIIIPAYNEQDNIERVVDNIITNYPQYDYIIVNDGSIDRTSEICRNRNYKMIDLPLNLGLTGAVQTGIRYAIKHNYDAAVQLDGDGQHDPKYIERMLNELQNNDIVIGSRYKNEKKPISMRMLGSTIITFFIKTTTGVKINDPTSGMRLYRSEVLEEFANSINLGPEPDTIAYLIKSGKKVKEVQVTMNDRIAGKSYLTLIRSLKYMILMTFSILIIQPFRGRRKN